jgi:hypothetical protein
MANVTLLEILARMNPRIWEIIHPHVPVLGGVRFLSGVDEVALNPQPLPPKEVLAGAVLARQMAEGAVLVHAQNQGGQGFLREVVDDWCGTHGPHPWPPGWPHPDPDPDPHPWEVAQVFAVAALVFARFSAGLEDAELRDAFRAAADTAGERAVRGLEAKG